MREVRADADIVDFFWMDAHEENGHESEEPKKLGRGERRSHSILKPKKKGEGEMGKRERRWSKALRGEKSCAMRAHRPLGNMERKGGKNPPKTRRESGSEKENNHILIPNITSKSKRKRKEQGSGKKSEGT